MAAMHAAVRPAAVETLEAPVRLGLMAAALRRFFAGVALAIVVLLVSGVTMVVLSGGLSRVHWSVHAMLGVGLVMVALFGHVRLAVYPRLRRALAEQAWPVAAASLDGIRRLVVVNLVLGTAVFVIAIVGRAL